MCLQERLPLHLNYIDKMLLSKGTATAVLSSLIVATVVAVAVLGLIHSRFNDTRPIFVSGTSSELLVKTTINATSSVKHNFPSFTIEAA